MGFLPISGSHFVQVFAHVLYPGAGYGYAAGTYKLEQTALCGELTVKSGNILGKAAFLNDREC